MTHEEVFELAKEKGIVDFYFDPMTQRADLTLDEDSNKIYNVSADFLSKYQVYYDNGWKIKERGYVDDE